MRLLPGSMLQYVCIRCGPRGSIVTPCLFLCIPREGFYAAAATQERGRRAARPPLSCYFVSLEVTTAPHTASDSGRNSVRTNGFGSNRFRSRNRVSIHTTETFVTSSRIPSRLGLEKVGSCARRDRYPCFLPQEIFEVNAGL